MAIRDEIMAGPVSIAKLQERGTPRPSLADSLFANFLHYAKRRWSYLAGAKAGGEALLNGTATAATCGGIASALRMMLEEDIGLGKGEVESITISGYVWTKPEYMCFDPAVVGNVREAGSTSYRNGCVFSEHCYLRCGLKYYDPCLASTYIARDQCVLMKPEVLMKGEFMRSPDGKTVLMCRKDEQVHGWQGGAWMRFPAGEIRKHVGESEIETLCKHSVLFSAFMKTVK